ncbi:4-hydroxybenzoyl-CoA thioesterase [Paracoccus acridae]|uniref:4-hydroxybenzoyl-CoA thioesterase n=1 Tax=Paracoccus acridae TaxID=1795310 RepID=A0ABQ1VMY7_9RHOB|nr:acyl-CoA thioesterase [Paracoccus acridae]GGF77270.1 4-hydroxybenzoyl-CoA thioesterase [Paracoccus acridae]
MSYRRRIPVEFNHCDPAGIVFYPRYFEMLNSTIENFFADVLAYPFARIHVEEHCAVPTAHIDATFHAPSRLGEMLDFVLEIEDVGRSSLRLVQRVSAGGQDRLRCTSTLVWVGRDGRAAPWPDAIRMKMNHFKETSDAA